MRHFFTYVSSDRMKEKDRFARWKLVETMSRMNHFSDYEHQHPLLFEDVADELGKNRRTTRAEMYYHEKRGRLEIVKIPKSTHVSGTVFPFFATLRKDGSPAKPRGRRRSGFILSRKMIDVLSKNMYTDANGEIRIKIPIVTMTETEALTVIYRMRNKRRAHV